jgi:hypothetical protein
MMPAPPSALAARPRPDLGLLANAMGSAPAATLTASGIVLGVLWGSACGALLAAATKQAYLPWITGGALTGALLTGSYGYVAGQNTQNFLAGI